MSIRDEIKNDPEAKKRWDAIGEKMRPAILRALAHHETILSSDSPTSQRRGGNKLQPTDELIGAISDIIEAGKGRAYEESDEAFKLAMKNSDFSFFLRMAQAAQYVRQMPHSNSLFSKHLIAIRKETAHRIESGDSKPSWQSVKNEVTKQLGQVAYADDSKSWSRLKAEVGKSYFSR